MIKEQIELMCALQRENIVDIGYYFRMNNISATAGGMTYKDFRRLINELRISKNEENNKQLFRIMSGPGAETLSLDRLHRFVHDFYLECSYI
jgi:hypothetical protein